MVYKSWAWPEGFAQLSLLLWLLPLPRQQCVQEGCWEREDERCVEHSFPSQATPAACLCDMSLRLKVVYYAALVLQ